ncbi:hypothetical protein KIN20_025079 [Parelaphostrongylus tenuis]|uniref:Uncharacterized protein n=1 Tax=Parelaphostrongylus tenuis TaxID=148309 RepID=A0AAD5NAH3_PARTN|nr:hypothetical protein KIN20_025079 [Parelaphostrongylus tenuis]
MVRLPTLFPLNSQFIVLDVHDWTDSDQRQLCSVRRKIVICQNAPIITWEDVGKYMEYTVGNGSAELLSKREHIKRTANNNQRTMNYMSELMLCTTCDATLWRQPFLPLIIECVILSALVFTENKKISKKLSIECLLMENDLHDALDKPPIGYKRYSKSDNKLFRTKVNLREEMTPVCMLPPTSKTSI